MEQEKRTQLDIAIAEAEPMEVDPSLGLSSLQVASRKEAGLSNAIKKHVSKSYLRILSDNLFNFLNGVLLVVIILLFWVKAPFSRFFFAFILLANITIGLIQDIHARKLTDKLKIITDPKINVIRDGQEQTIAVDAIVLSDIIVLKQGDQIPADCRMVNGECKVDESMLTGEAEHILKREGDTLFSGTYLVAGTCVASVVSVGASNYAEKLQKKASKFNRPKSEIKTVTWRIMVVCCSLAVLFALVNFVTYTIQGLQAGYSFPQLFDPTTESTKSFVDSVTGSVVGMLPTGMFLLTSLTLAVGVIQLAKRRILVQELYCIEGLARVDTVCFDKTGTLTDGSMAIESLSCFNGYHRAEVGYAVSTILHFTKDQNATATALRNAYGDHSTENVLKIGAFDSARKYSYVSLAAGITYAMGAYDFLPIERDKEVEAHIADLSSRGYRCVVLATGNNPKKIGDLPKKMTVCGLIAISDHLKEDAKENVEWFQNNDVTVYVISGDDPQTVAEIARRAGVNGADRFISLAGKSEEEVIAAVSTYRVFGRVSPDQKAIIIGELKRQGHKVAMTGDGVNDILAMKVADCSIAMASGADAAKNVAHLVALDSDFSRLPDVVAQGRRVINNLERTCSLFLSKTLFAIIVSFVSMILSWTVKIPGTTRPFAYPFTTSNMIVWETFAIGIAAFFLALQPSNERLNGGFFSGILIRAVPAGIAEVLAAFGPLLFSLLWPAAISAVPGDAYASYQIGIALSVMVFSFISLIFLCRVCWPFDRFRSVVFGLVCLASVSVMVIDFFLRGQLLGITWDNYNREFYLVVFGSEIIATAFYFTMNGITEFIWHRIERKKKEIQS